MSKIELPYPPDWQERQEYLRHRIMRMKRALAFCKGRAADLKPLVVEEIKILELKLHRLETEGGFFTPL